ncbi:hypothetical protein [Variovorax sp. RO1]|uniref:hypothetical protein n=1 Tax=Variovorax sp. RO1 TaxID=2066034 RepID=UPI002150939B|nr:hypothetical protein [Variovorax sp. RO1]
MQQTEVEVRGREIGCSDDLIKMERSFKSLLGHKASWLSAVSAPASYVLGIPEKARIGSNARPRNDEGGGMPKHHSATITLRLPVGIDADAEIAALRAAGIPVDALGNAERGFLFVRFSNGWGNRTNIFRWFAGSIEQDLRKSDIEPYHRQHGETLASRGLNR